MIHCSKHFVGGTDWTKGYTARHTTAPNATRVNEKVLERWRSKVVVLYCFAVTILGGSLGWHAAELGVDRKGLRGEHD